MRRFLPVGSPASPVVAGLLLALALPMTTYARSDNARLCNPIGDLSPAIGWLSPAVGWLSPAVGWLSPVGYHSHCHHHHD